MIFIELYAVIMDFDTVRRQVSIKDARAFHEIADGDDPVPPDIPEKAPAQVVRPIIVNGQHDRDAIFMGKNVEALRMVGHEIVKIMGMDDVGLLAYDEILHHFINAPEPVRSGLIEAIVDGHEIVRPDVTPGIRCIVPVRVRGRQDGDVMPQPGKLLV